MDQQSTAIVPYEPTNDVLAQLKQAADYVSQREGRPVPTSEVAAVLDAALHNDGERRYLATALESAGYDLAYAESMIMRMQAQMQRQGYGLPGSQDTGLGGQTEQVRRLRMIESRAAYERSPIARRALHAIIQFALGGGASWHASDEKVKDVIARFWSDPNNEDVLTGPMGQADTLLDWLLDGNSFLAFFTGTAQGEDGTPLVTRLRANEITDIVPDQHNRHRAAFYRRVFWPQGFNFKTGEVKIAPDSVTLYYPDVENRDEQSYLQAGNQLEQDAFVLHGRINATEGFGVPELYPVLDYLQAQRGFLQDHFLFVKACTIIAWHRKTTAPIPPQKLAAFGQPVQNTPQTVGMPIQLGFDLPGLPAGGIYSTGPGVDIEPMNNDTGSGDAIMDNKLFLMMIAAAVGFGPHYFGDAMDASRATTTTMELYILKNIQWWQQKLTAYFRKVMRFVIFDAVVRGDLPGSVVYKQVGSSRYYDYRLADGVSDNIDLDFPPILERDIAQMMLALKGAAELLPASDRTNKLIAQLALTYLGVNNIEEELTAMAKSAEKRKAEQPPAFAAQQGQTDNLTNPANPDQPQQLNQQNAKPQGAPAQTRPATGLAAEADRYLLGLAVEAGGVEAGPDWPQPADELERRLRIELAAYFDEVAKATEDGTTNEERRRAYEVLLILLLGLYATYYRQIGVAVAGEITAATAAQQPRQRKGSKQATIPPPAGSFRATGFDAAAFAEARARLIDDVTWRAVEAATSDGTPAAEVIRDMKEGRTDRIAATEAATLLLLATAAAAEQSGIATARWTTAGDNRVDGYCASQAGKVYPLDQIRTMIPAHVGCRCRATPTSLSAPPPCGPPSDQEPTVTRRQAMTTKKEKETEAQQPPAPNVQVADNQPDPTADQQPGIDQVEQQAEQRAAAIESGNPNAPAPTTTPPPANKQAPRQAAVLAGVDNRLPGTPPNPATLVDVADATNALTGGQVNDLVAPYLVPGIAFDAARLGVPNYGYQGVDFSKYKKEVAPEDEKAVKQMAEHLGVSYDLVLNGNPRSGNLVLMNGKTINIYDDREAVAAALANIK